MTYSELARKLRRLGCEFQRQGRGDYEIWRNPRARSRTPIPNWRGRDLKPGTVSAILRQLGISRDDFDRA